MTPRLVAVRLAIALKAALQAVLPRRRADVYIACTGEWRYPSFLLRALRRCGDPLLEVPRRDAIMAWGADGFRNFMFRTRIVGDRGPVTAPVVVAREPDGIRGNVRSRIRVSVDWFSSEARTSGVVMPYFVHPDLAQEPDVDALASDERPFRIGFAGATGRETYSEVFRFPMLDRMDVLGEIIERFGDRVAVARSRAELDGLEPAGPAIVFVTAEGRRHVPTTYVLAGRDYLAFLGSCTFFLAPPGFRMPVSHNLVEAMSLGAIPILNYADWLYPPLEDGIDCLAFSTRAELASAVERALAMGEDEIARLRDGVAAYYAEHLSVDSFARRLCPLLEHSPTIVVNAEKETVALWRSRQPEQEVEPR